MEGLDFLYLEKRLYSKRVMRDEWSGCRALREYVHPPAPQPLFLEAGVKLRSPSSLFFSVIVFVLR